VDSVTRAIKDATGLPVGVTTGAWIEPDLTTRLRLVRERQVPDYTSVNLSEPGAAAIIEALLGVGVGIEAGVWTVEDAEQLVTWPKAHLVIRMMIEPVEVAKGDAGTLVESINNVLGRAGLQVPRLLHGDGEATWVLIEDAIRRGLDTRIGFEDTFVLPDGQQAVTPSWCARPVSSAPGGLTDP
jgi:uncharacterized protein (DUF849 family)